MTDEPRKETLAKIIEAFASDKIQPYQQDMIDFLTSGKPLVISSEYNHAQARVIAQIIGTSPTILLIDEIKPLISPDLAKIIDEYGASSKKSFTEHQGQMVINLSKSLAAFLRDDISLTNLELLHPEEHGMVKKGGKLVKRHHPIPKTPRSPRQSKRR